MLVAAGDHGVRIKSREDIAKIAMSWWLVARRHRYNFNICNFVTEVLAKRLRKKGILEIKFYNFEEIPERAYVTFNPLVLHIDAQIWQDAGLGKTYARYIVAHEIGHIVLHDEFAVAFSDEKAAQLVYLQDEESGEWQANIFADYFLVPDYVALRLKEPDVIAGLCVVSDHLALRRVREATSAKNTIPPPYGGELCNKCWNLTLLPNGSGTECDTCG